jgi:hypothetical protein
VVCPHATSEAEARWPIFGLVVVATTSRRDNNDQMIRPLKMIFPVKIGLCAILAAHTMVHFDNDGSASLHQIWHLAAQIY